LKARWLCKRKNIERKAGIVTGAAQRLALFQVGKTSENFEIFQEEELCLVAKNKKGRQFGVFRSVSFQQNTHLLCLFLFVIFYISLLE